MRDSVLVDHGNAPPHELARPLDVHRANPYPYLERAVPEYLIPQMDDHQLERVRRICLSLPETSEKLAWGEPTFRVKGKLFAMCASASNHHGGGRDALWCHAPAGAQQGLVEAAPDRFFVPAYVGAKGWIGMWLDRVDDAEIEIHAVQAYRVVAPKKLRELLDQDDGG